MNLFKKAAGLFVTLPEESADAAAPAAEDQAPVEAPAQVDVPADLAADADYIQVQKAIGLLAKGVPPQAVLLTMETFGMNPAALLQAFDRTEAVLRAQVEQEGQAMEARKARNEEIMGKLRDAMNAETEDCEKDLAGHSQAIQSAQQRLEEVKRSAAIFDGPQGAAPANP
jgi:hypothetical protein